MKIAILGAGNVGGTLGGRFAEAGHEVFFGVPNPSEYIDKFGFGIVGTVAETAETAEIIVLAVPFDAAAAALSECGNLANKIIVDATNPLKFQDGALNLTIGFQNSGAEQIAEKAIGAKVVKCFNQTGFGNMAEPTAAGVKSVMFVCGDDHQANEKIRDLSEQTGFETLNIGDLKQARLLEPLAALWIHLSMTTELKRDFAFGLLRKNI